jgi:hypothetical protein
VRAEATAHAADWWARGIALASFAVAAVALWWSIRKDRKASLRFEFHTGPNPLGVSLVVLNDGPAAVRGVRGSLKATRYNYDREFDHDAPIPPKGEAVLTSFDWNHSTDTFPFMVKFAGATAESENTRASRRSAGSHPEPRENKGLSVSALL